VTLLQVAALGGWLIHPGLGWAAAAVAVGGLSALAAVLARRHRGAALAAAVLALAGAGVAFQASRRIQAVERRWDAEPAGVRESLISGASRRLQGTLTDAVGEARDLAERGLTVTDTTQAAAVRELEAAVGTGGPERGVAVLEPDGTPWAWGGRHRLPPDTGASGLAARITPFYATLEARRQGPAGRLSVGHVLLDADSAIPDRGNSLAARFAHATDVELHFYRPGQAPYLSDVFDYCLPACSDSAAHPDTLFSVRLVPPSQGAYKLMLLAESGRLVSLVVVLLAVLAMVTGAAWARAAGLAAAVGLFVFTSAGTALGLGTLFSSATYFADLLGPFTASSGALALSALLAFVLAVGIWWWRPRRTIPGMLAAGVLLLLAPRVLQILAEGITPPAAGIGTVLWLEWEGGLALGSAAVLLLAAALVRGRTGGDAPRWATVAACAWAVAAALGGLALWRPVSAWPTWYPYVWIPAFGLAVLPARRTRLLAATAIVAGTLASLLTWGAAIEGRLALATRDADGLTTTSDPYVLGLLERFGDRLTEKRVPLTAADLYARWARSALDAGGYPGMLATWSPTGVEEAQLMLADLHLPPALLQATARSALERRTAYVDTVHDMPGTRYILSVPFPDGSVVTVGVGPRSRLITPVRVARFLRGERPLPAPYAITLSEPVVGGPVAPIRQLRWQREGWRVRGEQRLELSGGMRHLHVMVDLGGATRVLIRAILVVVLDAALIAILWVLAEGLLGRFRLGPGLRDLLTFRSYRSRLGAALAVFFVLPTGIFAAWTGGRLAGEAQRSRDLIIGQTLQDATGAARTLVGPPVGGREVLGDLAERLGVDLVIYNDGALLQGSAPVLVQLGLIDQFIPPPVFEDLAGGDELEVTVDQRIAGRPTRVGYRTLGLPPGRAAVLAAPRLVDDADLLAGERDLGFGLVLAMLVGLGAAAALATVAVRTLARPVQALRAAALSVGRGEALPPFGDEPTEFVPVMEAFERMARDVTQGRAALDAQRQRTAAVLRHVASGVVAFDEHFVVVTSNLRAEEFLGRVITAGDPIARLNDAAWVEVWAWVRGVAAGTADAEPREFSVGARQMRVQVARLSGAARGWVVALDDVTELSRAVRVLAWGELARQIAHQIKNPLTPIRLGIQHLRRSYRAPRGDFGQTLDQTSDQMLAEIERLDAIARAFARFGAPPAGTEPLDGVDVVHVARDAAALYALGETPGVRVSADGALYGLARRDELKEVLINLIENARTAGAGDIEIVVHADVDGGVRMAVRDDGSGIPEADLPQIFEPRFSTTTSGSGLGLAICKRLVESWGGTIDVTSAPGAGTTVTTVLQAPPAEA